MLSTIPTTYLVKINQQEMENKVTKILYFNNDDNQLNLFNFALKCAKTGKVLYILNEELSELPQLSQDHKTMNGQDMKMISFVYAKTLGSLVECISTLPDWKNIPAAILVDDLAQYCDRDKIQDACGIVSFLIDAANSCAQATNMSVTLCVSVTVNNVGHDYCSLLKELYFDCDLEIEM